MDAKSNRNQPAEIIEQLLSSKLRFSVRVYFSGNDTVCEVFAKDDWCAVANIFPRGVFELDMDNRMNPIAKAVFVL